MRNIIASILVFACIFSMTACHNATLQNLENQTVNCGEAQVADLASQLLPSVEKLLTGQSVNWLADLDTLVSSMGSAAICAIQDAIADANGSGSGSAVSVKLKAVSPADMNAIVEHGMAYIKQHGWKITQ